MSSSLLGLKREMDQMKRRIAALERTLDSIATKDDIQAIEDAREDLNQGKTISLTQAKKKSWLSRLDSPEERIEILTRWILLFVAE